MLFYVVFKEIPTKIKKVQKNKRKTIDISKEICYSLHRKISDFAERSTKLCKYNKNPQTFCWYQQTKTTFLSIILATLNKKTTFFQKIQEEKDDYYEVLHRTNKKIPEN